MRSGYLLDTHVLLWLNSELKRIPRSVITTLDAADHVYYSAASAWELSIKQNLGKIHLSRRISESAAQSGFEELPITTGYAEVSAALPLHHRDPFDRMIVAQAISENLALVTADRRLPAYGVKILSV